MTFTYIFVYFLAPADGFKWTKREQKPETNFALSLRTSSSLLRTRLSSVYI